MPVPDLPFFTALIPAAAAALGAGWRARLRRKSRAAPAAGLLGFGLAKLLLLALPVAPLLEACLAAHPLARSGWAAWAATFFFSCRIFLLISGVQDVLRALGLWLGFMPPEILRAPFAADTFTGMWRRFCHPARKRTGPFGGMVLFLATAMLAQGISLATGLWLALHLLLLGIEKLRGGRGLLPGFIPQPLRAVFVIVVFFIGNGLLFSAGPADAWQGWRLMLGQGKAGAFTYLLDARLGGAWPLFLLWSSMLTALLLSGLRRFWARHRLASTGGGVLLGVLALTAGPPLNDMPSPEFQRSWIAQWKHQLFQEGSRHVFAGREGWLYDAAELDRITRADVSGGLEQHLLSLQARLSENDAYLLVVPVPGKLALHPEPVLPAKYAAPFQPHGLRAALERLSAAGIQILDPAAVLWEMRRRQPLYFQQDSHWTPEAMKETALRVARQVRQQWPRLAGDETPLVNVTILERADIGDLVRGLAVEGTGLFAEESATLVSFTGLDARPDSPILVVGGSLCRVFDDPALSFGHAGARPQRAGFIQQLSALLARPLFHLDEQAFLQDPAQADGRRLVIWLLPAWRL